MPEQWPRVKEIVAEALEREPQGRQAYLDEACAEDAPLRVEVESLLRAYDESDRLFDVEATAPSTHPGNVGPYRLIRELGFGGMGQVWLAEQTEPVRRLIALKLIRAGMFDAEVVHRFQAERQSLAIMDHPAIAKVFDAGTTPQGQPYFAMEYVAGLPITDYCDQNKLGIPERLKLFLQVCEGVQHAHQKAIIHRDLKPSNILVVEVDGKPRPRIIDFGLAKAMASSEPGHTLFTHQGAFLGTPGYISPEQADPNVQDIDTRADVYSLGVLLYELLTGLLPFDTTDWKKQKLDEMLRQLRESDPRRPSSKVNANRNASPAHAAARGVDPRHLVKLLRGDLDWIVMKALEKDRERRYGSAFELAADVERHLENRPVVARPVSTVYRFRKYIRRNRASLAVVTGIFILLIAFAIAQAIQLRRITRERDRADRITGFMTNMFEVSDPSEARGNTVTAREILDKSSKEIETSLAQDPQAQAQMMEVMGEVYESLGLYGRAHVLLKQAVETRRRVLGAEHPDTLKSMAELAATLHEEGQEVESEKLHRETLVLRQKVLGPRDKATLASMVNLASALSRQGRFAEAEKMEREACILSSQTRGPENEDTLTCMSNLANTLSNEHKYSDAEPLRRASLEVRTRIFGPDSPDTLISMANLADTLYWEGHYAEAESLGRQTIDIQRRVLGPEHPMTLIVMYNLASALNKEGRYVDAEALGRTILEARIRVLGPQHPRTLLARYNLAISLIGEGHYPEAEKLLSEAIEGQEKVLAPNHPDTAASIYELAVLKTLEGRSEEAVSLLDNAVAHGLPSDDSRGIETDPSFNSLHNTPAFKTLIGRIKTPVQTTAASHSD
jgi:non-specific serine/threonine protein kinase/serine/threonine-protein kinase